MDIAHKLKMLFVALAVCLSALAVGAGYAFGHWCTLHLFGKKPRHSIIKNKDQRKRQIAHLLSILAAVAVCIGIASMVAAYAISLWGRTLGLGATIGISIGIVLSYLADAKKL